ncbi:MAG: hypothetical protein FWC01_02680 [Treponema sp.]|nr:hypothetical protein [Treponema sp.]MCL2236961.1 hypothetical protein [Treponema sp.]
MKRKKNREYFAVFVPHRDTRLLLKNHFKELAGTYNFPYVSPLASLSKPLKPDELKQLAKALRCQNGSEKFNIGDIAYTEFNEEMFLYGPKLDVLLPSSFLETSSQKIKKMLSPSIIGTSLMFKTPCYSVSSFAPLREPLSFRAAAVANMYWQLVTINAEKAFKWKIGKLYWLPKQIKS